VLRGSFDLLCLLADANEVRNLKPDLAAIARLDARGLSVMAASDIVDVDYVTRCFYPALGIPEDPVTGSAHCALAPWWGDRLERNKLVGAQLSERGGVLGCELQGDRVILTGQAVITVAGQLLR
jgi:PhzF family phenazine biosynthesis protein